jgi:hypothetical protein
MSVSKLLKWVSGGIEAVLGIPVLGGLIVVASGWATLQFMFFLHLITFIVCLVQKERFHGSVFGMITSLVAFIPFLGMVMHIATALILFIDAARGNRKRNDHVINVK